MNDMPVRPKILIVEDSPQNIRILMELLQEEFKIITAISGEKALTLAGKAPIPDLILLDLILPGMDGYEVCTRLKQDEKTRGIPVIVVTAVSEAMDETRAFQCGAIDYITKPYHPPVVKAKVKTHLELKRYQEQLEEMVRIRTADLEKARRAAEAADEAKGQFITNMSHEFQTPLNGIIAAVDLILGREPQAEFIPFLRTIRTSGLTLHKMIANILGYSESRKDAPQISRTAFKLDALMSALPREIVLKGVTRRIALKFAVGDAPICNSLIGDPERLAEILGHLIENAAKFTDKKPEATVGIEVADQKPDELMLRFFVKDNGIGIPFDHHDKIFEAFSQVDASSIRQFDGLGMGLSICKELVGLMDGDIWLESVPGEGSTFFFTVRCGIAEPADILQLDNCRVQGETNITAESELAALSPDALYEVEIQFEQLAGALQDMNPDAVESGMRAINASLEPALVEELNLAVSEYEYDKALLLLKEILIKIKSSNLP